jgi:hypothetical protein
MDELDDIILWHVETLDGKGDHRVLDLGDLSLPADDDAAFERWLASVPAQDLDTRLSRLVDGHGELSPSIDRVAW